MLGLQLIRFEVKHQVLSCSCYAPIVLRVALKEKTPVAFAQASGILRVLHASTQQPTSASNTGSCWRRNPQAATLWSPDPT